MRKLLVPALCCTASCWTFGSSSTTIQFDDDAEGRPVIVDDVSFRVEDADGIATVDVFELNPADCNGDFFPLIPFDVGGATSFSFSQSYANSSFLTDPNDPYHLCVQVIDALGDVSYFLSEAPILLSNIQLDLEVGSLNGDVAEDPQQYEFIFDSEDVQYVLSLSGSGSPGATVRLRDSNGNVVAESTPIEANRKWSLEGLTFAIDAEQLSVRNNFFLGLVYESNGQEFIVNEKQLAVNGGKVDINIVEHFDTPIQPNAPRSGYLQWDILTSLSVNHRLLLLDEQGACASGIYDENASQVLTTGSVFTFAERHFGRYACIEVVDKNGRRFVADLGLVQGVAKPEITIVDDLSTDSPYVDEFIWQVTDTLETTVKVSLVVDRNADVNCALQNGTVIDRVEGDNGYYRLALANPFYNGQRLCVQVENALGGRSAAVSSVPLRLANDPGSREPTGSRIAPTPYPTRVNIPAAMQNSTVYWLGCRAAMLARDVIVTAGHCGRPTRPLGQFTTGHHYGATLPSDELLLRDYQDSRREVYDFVRENRENLTSEEIANLFIAFNEETPYPLPSFDADRYTSPYYGPNLFAAADFADYSLIRLKGAIERENLEYAMPLVYTHPTSLHLQDGEYRGHNVIEQPADDPFPFSGWKAGTIYTKGPGFHNAYAALLTVDDTIGGESGSSLWAEDPSLGVVGVVGSVRGGGAWSSTWLHGAVTREELAKSRGRELIERLENAQPGNYSYRAFKNAAVSGDAEQVRQILNAGVDPNVNRKGQVDGFILARVIEFTQNVKNSIEKKATAKRLQKYQNYLDTLEVLALGGADPRLPVLANIPSRKVTGDTPLHIAVRTGNPDIVKTLWFNFTDYAFETESRIVANSLGNTALHEAIMARVDLEIIKYLFTDVGTDLFTENQQGDTAIELLLGAESFTPWHTDVSDWVGKAYLYRAAVLSGNTGAPFRQRVDAEWKRLLCESHDWNGHRYRVGQLLQVRQQDMSDALQGALQRMSNISGIDAAYICD